MEQYKIAEKKKNIIINKFTKIQESIKKYHIFKQEIIKTIDVINGTKQDAPEIELVLFDNPVNFEFNFDIIKNKEKEIIKFIKNKEIMVKNDIDLIKEKITEIIVNAQAAIKKPNFDISEYKNILEAHEYLNEQLSIVKTDNNRINTNLEKQKQDRLDKEKQENK